MSLRAKRAAMTAKVVGGPTAPGGDEKSATDAPPSPRAPLAGSSAAVAPTGASSHSPTPSTATQQEKMNQIAASFAPAIIGGHQAKQPPSYVTEDSLGPALYDFEKERMIVVSSKDAKELSMIYNIPSHDVSLVRRHRVSTTVGAASGAYQLPSPADVALEEHDQALSKKDASLRSGVPPHVETCLAGYQHDWYGVERPFRNIGVPGSLPADDTTESSAAEPTSPRSTHSGLTMPDQTARLNYLFIPPSASFVVPRTPLHQIVYETGPNADSAISESLSLGLDEDITETEDKDNTNSSEEPSMIEVPTPVSTPEEDRKNRHVRDRSASEAVQVNIAALKEAALRDTDPTDPVLLTPSEQGKTVIGVHRDLLFGQLYPLPDPPHIHQVVAPDVSSLGMRFKITPRDLSFGLNQLEPYFCILSLFDLTTGERLSENFYFEINNDATASMIPAWHEAAQYNPDGKPGHVRKNVDALFWVPHASPDIWMVLRVEKILQGDSYDNVVDPYMRPDTMKGKEREKLDATVASFTSRLGGFRQAFCWGMVPIFSEDKQYVHGPGAVMKQLNRYKGDVSNAAFLEASAEVKTGSKRLKWIPGSFTFDLTPVSDTSIEAACGSQPYVDWTGRVCTPVHADAEAIHNSASDGAGSDDEAQDSGKKDKEKEKKKPKLTRKERSSLSMTTKAMKLLGATGGGLVNQLIMPGVPEYYPAHDYVQQIGCFPPPAVPFTDPHNVAYVYPSQLIISKSVGQTVARNLVVQVSLLTHEDDDLSEAINSVYTRGLVAPLTHHQMSAVNYHDKSPVFYDEFKIALPTKITKSHSLRFTFYHVQCQSKSASPSGSGSGTAASIAAAAAAASASALTMIGYSIFPILNNDMIPEGEITLPIMSVGDGGSLSSSSQSVGSAKPMMDPKKASFTFRLKLSSSIYTSDKYLHPFFLEYGKGRISTKQAKASDEALKEAPQRVVSITNALAGLTKVKPRKLLQFLPTILHQLFHIMCTQPVPISNKAFHTLIQVLNNIHQKESEMQVTSLSAVLQHYVDYLFMSPPNVAPLADVGVTFSDTKAPPSIVNSLHTQILRAWYSLVLDTAKADHEKLHRFAWFFFKLIYLSSAADAMDVAPPDLKEAPTRADLEEMATNSLLNAAQPPSSSSSSSSTSSSPSKDELTSPRSEAEDYAKDSRDRISRFDIDYKVGLKKLVLLLAWEVQERLNSSLQQSKDLCRRIASFLVDMFSISDRGFITDLATRSLRELAPREDEVCWELKADFWRILSSYEHWPQLTLSTTLNIDSKNVGVLEDHLSKMNFLQSALIRDLLAPMTDKASRLRALHILQTLFTKADLDPRLNPAIMNSIKASQDGKAPIVSNSPPIDLEDPLLISSESNTKRSRKSIYSSRKSGTLRTKRAGIQHMALSDPTTSSLKTQYLQGYFPVLLRGVDAYETLKKADFDEQRVFLSCWIYLLKNIDVRLLRQWWKHDSYTRNAAFLQTLTLCGQVFEYQGYAPLMEKLSFTSEVTRAVATKALIEELYSGGGAAAAPAMNLRQKRMDALKAKGTATAVVPGITLPSGSNSPVPAERNGAAASGSNQSSAVSDALGSARGTSSLSVAAGAGMATQLREAAAEASAGGGHGHKKKRRHGKDLNNKDHKWRHPGLDSERGRYDSNVVRESRISHEASVVILDVLEWYMVAKESDLNTNAQSNLLMNQTVSALLTLLSRRQGVDLQILLLRVLTAYAHTFSKQLFLLSTPYISQLTPRILALCNYENERVRMGASAFFFLLMKLNLEHSPAKNRNFTRVKVQAIIALSKLVAAHNGIRDPSFLNRALNGILAYSKQYNTPTPAGGSSSDSVPVKTESNDVLSVEGALLVQQVSLLVTRLRAILEGSVKIQQHAGDNDMLTDLYHQIASSYKTAPDLRVTWLESLADLHARNDAWAEAGQCLVHIAALIAEYLQILEPTEGSMKGAAAFEAACVSAVEEQSMLDAQNMMDEDGVGETHIFTETGLCDVVERAIAYLTRAHLYESAHELYKLLLPVHEKNHDYAKLASSHAALSNIFNKIMESISNQSRLFGSFYRVGFYGARFGDLNGKEYVYKEPKITRLGEIQDRLLALYSRKLGVNINVITTSGEVETKKLDQDACYMQLTSVLPYFDDWELKQRKTDYERSNNIGRFTFETPFVKGSSKTQSPQLSDQWKRKTIISVEAAFPYMKRRLPVLSKESIELSPIETAIGVIEARVQALAAQLTHPNAKTLPLVLQGSVRITVNAGPTEISKVFLAPGCEKTYGEDNCNRLRIILQDFLDICQEALVKNKEIIASSQLQFHQELEEGYAATKALIEPLLSMDSK